MARAPYQPPPEVKRLAIEQYLAGKASLRAIAAEVGVTAPTISRWVKEARLRGVTVPAPTDVAARVAALAPPPAAEPPPPLDLGDGSPATLMAALARLERQLQEQVARAQAQGDPRVATTALTAALKAFGEIRQLRNSVAKEGEDTLAFSREDIAAARASVQAKIDALGPATCPHCGSELRRQWALGGVTPPSTGGA